MYLTQVCMEPHMTCHDGISKIDTVAKLNAIHQNSLLLTLSYNVSTSQLFIADDL